MPEPEQSTISDEEPSRGLDPAEVPCEWCGDPSKHKIERVRKVPNKDAYVPIAIFFYVCEKHKQVAEDNKVLGGRRK